MKITRILVALGLALACGTALANTYQIEGSVDYHHTAGTGHSDDRFSLRADYYFTPVLTLNHHWPKPPFWSVLPRCGCHRVLKLNGWLRVATSYFPTVRFTQGRA